MNQKKIIIYHTHFHLIGGCETFVYNLCLNLWKYYDITVLMNTGDAKQLGRLRKIVNVERYDSKKEYVCDIFIRNSVWGIIPENIYSKENRYIEMRHTDYEFLQKTNRLDDQWHEMPEINEVVACGEFVGKQSRKVMHDKPTTILNILAPKIKTNKILRLISCTRIDADKGWENMVKLMDMLRAANIKYEWNIFTNNKLDAKCDYEEVHFYKQRFDIWDYLADADYTALLSRYEGLPYTVQESLQYGTPCIVSDIPGCTELIKDGVNGYVLPKDMNFDVTKLLNIPKLKEYDNKAKEKWMDYLGNPIYKNKKEKTMARVLVTHEDGFRDILLNRHVDYGEEYKVDLERASDLEQKRLCEIVEVW